MLKSYLKRIFQIASRGDATEVSYYSAVEELLNEYAESTGRKNVHVTPLPKKTEAGNPDFRVWDGKQHITGYIEAKAPTEEDLDRVEGTDQLERYLGTFPNVILTNFFEFRLYRNGSLIDKVLIARPFIVHKLKTVPPIEKEAEFLELLDKFFSFSLPRVRDAKSLATELANRTRFLRDEVIARELKEEEQATKGILGFYEAFKEYLISGLSKEDFADLYSQTITYGLFAARMRSENSFNRKLAYDKIPHTIGILRDVFRFISIEDLPPQMEWIIDDISEVLAVTDVKRTLHKYFHEGKGKDPIVHFYETFLAQYDPETREKRGVYYTPEPVVSYIVQSLHAILKDHFSSPDGFASETVTVLDPAAGTLTFLAGAAKLAVEEFVSKYGEGAKKDLVKGHILKNFYAFELMMAPYAVGHLKMSFLLEELGYRLTKNDRFRLYLTNALEMQELVQTDFPGMVSLSKESRAAAKVKKEEPILVILGNPPYSVSSANQSGFIKREMDLYKEDVRDEKNIQPLSDDYIKFIRFAHWKIDKAGKGVIGMITNNSYLSGLIHRGMRKKLLESFSEIYILNLHGSSRSGERCLNGSKDENVFDIMQGVAIALFIKKADQKGMGSVYYQDIYGLRPDKYNYLTKYDIQSTDWELLEPIQPYYFFVKKDLSLQCEYEKFTKVTQIFHKHGSGVKTNRDHLLVDFEQGNLKRRIQNMISLSMDDELFKSTYKVKDGAYWNTRRERDKVRNNKHWNSQLRRYSYRPFDTRWIYYQPNLIEIGRGGASKDVMCHFFKENVGLVVMRQYLLASVRIYNYVLCVEHILDNRFFISNRGTAFVFPLYTYPGLEKQDLFDDAKGIEAREPNISLALSAAVSGAYKKDLTPEQIFFYVYGILYSNTYRTKYAEFLKMDFPRVPFTENYRLFKKITEFGRELACLHLMNRIGGDRELPVQNSIAKFQGKGDNRVEKLRYEEKENRVYVSKDQYFEGITKEVWEYQIGGYQVCHKWLKDRKGRPLLLDDIKHYCKIVTALAKTIEIQKEIDDIYPEVEKETIEFGEL